MRPFNARHAAYCGGIIYRKNGRMGFNDSNSVVVVSRR